MNGVRSICTVWGTEQSKKKVHRRGNRDEWLPTERVPPRGNLSRNASRTDKTPRSQNCVCYAFAPVMHCICGLFGCEAVADD